MVQIEWTVVLWFGLGMVLLYGLGWLLLVPLKRVLWFLLNSLAGIVILLVLSALTPHTGIVAVPNPFSAVLAGFLGIPGVVLTLLIQNLL